MQDNHIADQRARDFVAGLRRFEQDSDAAAFAEQFADDAVTQRLDARGERHGEVERFWAEYRAQFDEIRTTFYNAIEADASVALEWTSEGVMRGGQPIRYRGTTCLGFDGDKVSWLRTYYDSAAFVQPESAGTG